MLVTNPCAPASRAWWLITSLIAPSTSPLWSSSCFSAASAAPSRGPTPRIARSSAWCTNPAVTLGAQLGDLGGQRGPEALGEAHGPSVQTVPPRAPAVPSPGSACHAGPVPIEPPPTPWSFPSPAHADGDIVAFGGDLSAGHAARGVPPGAVPDARRRGDLGDGVVVAGATAACCPSTVSGSAARCASRRGTSRSAWTPPSRRSSTAARTPRATASWIDGDLATAYLGLHEAGWAHSVEAWRDGELAGGLYGVAIGGLFAGESMFSRVRDASKVALCGLVDLLTRRVRRPAAARHPVADAAPRDPRSGRDRPDGVPRPARRSRSTCRCPELWR